MTNSEAARVIEILCECFHSDCKKKCYRCPRYKTDEEKQEAYEIAIDAIRKQNRLKEEFFKSGIEYAKAEFVKILERERDNVNELHKSDEIGDLIYTQVLGLQKAIELADSINYVSVNEIHKNL